MKQAMPDTTTDRTMEADREDHVDRLRAQWARELPDIDTEPMAIFGRAKRLSNLLAPSIEETFAVFGLDRGEFDVIATLRRSGPPYQLTPTEMYTTLMLSSGGLTHRLDRLEKAGLIERRKSKLDGRSVVVCLMPAGIELAEKAFRQDMKSELSFLQGLSPEERDNLAALLKKLVLEIEARL
ncbi:MarR family transcriptional regulator [Agrobacterium sp. TS43]|uniref:MarR family winged helix-turn-helix transcriptional regulator n=1 Tax=Agrobacterium TaxID=357 RepID=UPI0003823200|nr:MULTISPECIES: MarR family transcriptional regulator [Agrobacterium]EPR23169.1 transcriptional regulator [Agrobacterium radiobacter DSM 30147]KDR88135.1 MarR family transcriptional regulator [Agrobacterium tumefaciens GW4]KVK41737.1 MarR family transcriptional regulator [Agrobacterium sp. JL28]KVK41980.1 MarR family transcriptional regulator [Agrobacterium sp. LY4]KVK56487.1 MarR family transcriptional regulator [Agrobacterium sp. TS45]